MGDAIVRAKNWRLAFFGSLVFVVFPCIIGMLVLGMQPKAVPHIVDVFPDGSALYRGAVGKAWENFTPDRQNILFHLRRFINDTRSLSSDPAVVKRHWEDAYLLIMPSAANKLSAYAQEINPVARAQEERVSVEIAAENPISKDSWQVDWKESVYGPKGNLIDVILMRGIFKIRLLKPDKPMPGNPLGMYIDDFDWTTIKG